MSMAFDDDGSYEDSSSASPAATMGPASPTPGVAPDVQAAAMPGQGGGLSALAGFPSNADYMRQRQAADAASSGALDQQIAAIQKAGTGGVNLPLLAIAAGMLKPTRTGSFGESVGNAAGAALGPLQQMQNLDVEKANKIGALRVAQANIKGASLDNVMKYRQEAEANAIKKQNADQVGGYYDSLRKKYEADAAQKAKDDSDTDPETGLNTLDLQRYQLPVDKATQDLRQLYTARSNAVDPKTQAMIDEEIATVKQHRDQAIQRRDGFIKAKQAKLASKNGAPAPAPAPADPDELPMESKPGTPSERAAPAGNAVDPLSRKPVNAMSEGDGENPAAAAQRRAAPKPARDVSKQPQAPAPDALSDAAVRKEYPTARKSPKDGKWYVMKDGQYHEVTR